MEGQYHDQLKQYIHAYVMMTYRHTMKYPQSELYGLQSQDRRAAVSVMLNYIEGYARMRDKVMKNFFEISYASLKESVYVRYLAKELAYITQEEYDEAYQLKEKIAPMLYVTIKKL